jgi:hypothetical protein
MKLVLRITVTALLAGLLAVPAASAKPGGGNGHGKGAEKTKAAHEHKAGKEKKAKKDKSAKQAGKAEQAKKHGKKAEAARCESPGAAAAVLGGLFGSASECSVGELALEPPNLEGLGPGQYCHQLEAWMAANGGNFSTTYGSEGSGYANDHGKCASRRAHGEDLAPAALQSACDAAKAAGGELPEACKPAEEQRAQQVAPAAAELTTVLRLLSF